MKNSLNLIENYLSNLDSDLNNMLKGKKYKTADEIAQILYFLEEAEHNLFSILKSLQESMDRIKMHQPKPLKIKLA